MVLYGHIVHIESSPLPTKADLVLDLRFLSDLTYTTTDYALSIKINGRIIQANQTHDWSIVYTSPACLSAI